LQIALTVNGRIRQIDVPPNETLLQTLRERLELTGTKEACGTGECGACTVIVGGKPVCSCLTLTADSDGDSILTIEGLARGEEMDLIQQAFKQYGAIQCGYCTPGFVMATKALLNRNPNPSDDEIRKALVGNLCRCTGYTKIVEAVVSLAKSR
jgi:carbon-monoxide dehydrogenase small subunit